MDFGKITELGKRIYNNKMLDKKDENGKIILSDEDAIKSLVNQTFTSNGEIKTLEQFRIFNKLIVEIAETEAKPKLEPILNLIADYQSVGRYDTVVYTIPKKAKVKLALTATATGVDFVRISPSQEKKPARPETHQFGVYYNISDMISNPVNEFRSAVDYVVNEKIKYTFNKVMMLIRQAKTVGDIPAGQVIETTNVDILEYRKLENRLLRYGNGVKPVMIADRNLIDDLAVKQATTNLGVSGKEGILLTGELRQSLLRDVDFTQILRTTAFPTDNPFIDKKHNEVELPVNEGIIVAGGDKSPFKIRDFGEMRVLEGLPDIEDERVNIKIDFRMDVTLLLSEALGYVSDDAVKL
ncbi:hypothetical protein ACR77J_08060 [Tissierella praeacuta]|uniref:hypothetical protein n=1 Tax=Tissierella praeacuta TaxID=43131 RepID=UPI003DA45ABC